MLEKALLFRSKLDKIQFCFLGIEDILNKFLFQDKNSALNFPWKQITFLNDSLILIFFEKEYEFEQTFLK